MAKRGRKKEPDYNPPAIDYVYGDPVTECGEHDPPKPQRPIYSVSKFMNPNIR
jgi:hypothetical protein